MKKLRLQTNDNFNIKLIKKDNKVFIQSWDYDLNKIDFECEVKSINDIDKKIKEIYMRDWENLDYTKEQVIKWLNK